MIVIKKAEEVIQARGETLLPAIHKLINSIWNKKEFPVAWVDGDKKDCSNYLGISLLSTSYKVYLMFFSQR
jgi:hypothetical protein